MILATLADVTKHFGPEPVLSGVSFDIRPGEHLGLIGPNGTGKTTLLKILAGREEADRGSVELHPSTRLAMLEQQPDFDPQRTLWQVAEDSLAELIQLSQQAESIAHEISAADDPQIRDRLAEKFDRLQHELRHRDGYNLRHKIERVLHGLGFSATAYEQPVGTLSGGQQNRLLLAQLLLSGADLLLLDEPSNHLDLEATQWLEEHLAAAPQALVVVSHDRYFLDKVTTRTLELFHGTVDSYRGNFSAYWRQKQERLEVQRRTYEKQQEQIAKTEDFIRRNHYGQKHAQAEDRKKKLERIERVDPPREIAAPPMGFPPASRTGDIVLRAEHLSKGFAATLFDDLNLEITRGERWGILGPNGSGKTTLLRILVGQEPADAGEVHNGTGVSMAYYDQLRSGLDESIEAVEAVRPPVGDFNEQQRRDVLARFGVTGDMAFQRVEQLSGGERSRAGLARLAATAANVLVLDEPTNHLDLWARDALERSLQEFDGTVLLVSHDRYFLNRVVDHLLVFEPGGTYVIEGNYDAYVYRLAQRQADRAAEEKESAKAKSRRREEEKQAPRKRRFPYRKVADLEAEIFERETRVDEVHALLADPDTHRDGDRVRELNAELEQQKQSLEQLYEHWTEASELN